VATNLRQARLFVQAARSVVEGSRLLLPLLKSATDDELVFANGTALAAFPCTSRGGRGWPISTLLMDEAAHFVSDTEGPQVAERVFASLAPSTAQFGDEARIILASTPYGNAGLFADLFQRARSGELADVACQHATTPEMNPTIDRAFLERERLRDPESFRSEYEAEFLAGGAAFLEPERIAEAVADRQELLPEEGSRWIAGLDPAFSSDPFGLVIVGRDHADRSLLRVGFARRWRPAGRPGSFEERRTHEDAVLGEVAEACRRYGARGVTDQYAAPAVVDFLRRAGVPAQTVPMTAHTKTLAFTELRARLNTRTLELYEEPTLLAELRRLRTRYAAGRASVVNPRVGDSHGDLAQALALAVYEHDRRGVGSSGGASIHVLGPSIRDALGALETIRYGDVL
jgi:hypothetical protein